MNPAMYIFINKGLGMSTGKAAAQASHAAVEATLLSHPNLPQRDADSGLWHKRSNLWREWREGLHYMKLVMECRDTEHLLLTQKYLEARGFRTVLIIDEGHTEVAPISATALGVELVDKDDPHTAKTFETFRLYKDRKPKVDKPQESLYTAFTDGLASGFFHPIKTLRSFKTS